MQNNRLQNRLYESILSAAVKENHINELSLIPSEEELKQKIVISDNFENSIQKLFNQLKRKKKIRNIKLYTKRVAIVFLAVISVSFGAMMISPEVRAAVQKTIIEWFDKYTSINFTKGSSEDLSDWKFEYIPEGYEKIEDINHNDTVSLTFSNNENVICIDYTYYSNEYQTNIDNEKIHYETIDINGVKGYLFSKNKSQGISIVFQNQNTVFNIFSDTNDVNNIIKIAENIKN